MTDSTPTLEPCPFCGAAPWSGEMLAGWAVQCINRKCPVKPTIARMKWETLVADWNTRALDASGNDEREFTNELGNRIRLTIEGPTSASVNELTPAETVEVAAFVREYVERHPHLEEAYQRRRLDKPSGTAKRTLACFKPNTLADELLIYADKLRTWTLAEEEVGNVRPLIQLLKDAAAIARTQEQSPP